MPAASSSNHFLKQSIEHSYFLSQFDQLVNPIALPWEGAPAFGTDGVESTAGTAPPLVGVGAVAAGDSAGASAGAPAGTGAVNPAAPQPCD